MTSPKILARGLLVVCVVAGLLASAVLVPSLISVRADAKFASVPNHIVISEFRSRGSNPNSDTNEFIELSNPTSSPLTIAAGWTLERSGGCAPTVFTFYTFPNNVSLAAGQHYLIGGQAYSGTVIPDVKNVPIRLDDSGGIALIDNTSVIIDQVGMCSLTAFFEPKELNRLSGTSNQSYDRISSLPSGACVDTDNNAADFFLRKPSDPQNSSSPLTKCGNPTPVPPTSTTIAIPTHTPTYHDIVINEVAWMGTQFSSTDQWIELYNTTNKKIDLSDWQLQGDSGTIGINGVLNLKRTTGTLANVILPHEFFIIAQNVDVFKNFDVDQVDPHLKLWNCSGCGEALRLISPAPSSAEVDTADYYNGEWPAGDLASRNTMERTGPPALLSIPGDSPSAWFTYAGKPKGCINTAERIVTDHDGADEIQGTPGCPNWATTVTITPIPSPTDTRRPTGIPPRPYAHMVINEFLPRAGYDWNGDGTVDVFDEFIEVENLGPIDGNLSGWTLDAVADTTSSYTIPNMPLKVGQRALFYGSTTGILLKDSGATVRLVNTNDYPVDARGYGVVDQPDQSWCRIPDGAYWTHPCFPTPGLQNSLTGTIPGSPPNAIYLPPVCLMPDTAPDAFRQAECNSFGTDIIDPAYWDDQAGQVDFIVNDIYTKWHTFVR